MRTGTGGIKAQKTSRPYRCFLLRCRLGEGARSGEPAGPPAWRFTLQQAGEESAARSFACFHDLAAYLEAELTTCGPLAGHERQGSPEVPGGLADR